MPGHPESLPTLRARFLNEAKAFGLADLDAAAIRDSRPRALTQAISAWIYTLSSADGIPISGIEFASRHGDNVRLWALCERDTTTSAPRQVTAVSTDPVNVDHPELTPVIASSLRKRAPGYTKLGFPDPRTLV